MIIRPVKCKVRCFSETPNESLRSLVIRECGFIPTYSIDTFRDVKDKEYVRKLIKSVDKQAIFANFNSMILCVKSETTYGMMCMLSE